MTEKEKLMYDILVSISSVDAPIVFKGALITKLILVEHGYTKIQRATKDIDANWIGLPPTMPVLVNTISDALKKVNNQFIVEASREYGEGKSAGIIICDKETGDKILSMDIDIKSSSEKKYYYGEAMVKGVLANEILADKISAISSDVVYKHRTKDIIDVYALSQCVKINFNEISEVCQRTHREIQSFEAFINRRSDVEHAYNKLKGIEGKPPFDDVYEYMQKFIVPFKSKSQINAIWQPCNMMWCDIDRILNLKTIITNAVKQKRDSVAISESVDIRSEKTHTSRGKDRLSR